MWKTTWNDTLVNYTYWIDWRRWRVRFNCFTYLLTYCSNLVTDLLAYLLMTYFWLFVFICMPIIPFGPEKDLSPLKTLLLLLLLLMLLLLYVVVVVNVFVVVVVFVDCYCCCLNSCWCKIIVPKMLLLNKVWPLLYVLVSRYFVPFEFATDNSILSNNNLYCAEYT